MRLPRIILGSAAWIHLWQSQRKETARLRRQLVEVEAERDAWRDKFLMKVAGTPLYVPPPKPTEPVPEAPIGLRAKKLMLASRQGEINNHPTAEDVMAAKNH